MQTRKSQPSREESAELLRTLLIVQLGLAKVPQNNIRKIIGCSIGKVNEIVKHLPKSAR